MVPERLFLTKGVGRHSEKLASFEEALRNAGIAGFNIVKVSSIFPPGCLVIPKTEGLKLLNPGEIIFSVMAEASTNEPHRLVAASVGLAIPRDKTQIGYLSEHATFGKTEKKAGDYVEDIAAEMLATVMGLPFDPLSSWDEKREVWRISGKIYRTVNTTQSATGDKNGKWVTVIAAAVFVP